MANNSIQAQQTEARRIWDNKRRSVRQLESNIRELGKLYAEAVVLGDEHREARYSQQLGVMQHRLRHLCPTSPLV